MAVNRLHNELSGVVDLFVMTKFQECFVKCKEVIVSAQMEAEQERNDMVIEAAAALGIQALAEIDRWMDTSAFITSVYGSIDLCPPRIIQVCILLHAHVREYLPCHSMVQAWLKNPINLSHKQCGQVIRVYATHVLCPTGCQDFLKEIVDKCTSLSQLEKDSLLQQLQTKCQESLDGNGNECVTRRRLSIRQQIEDETRHVSFTTQIDFEEQIANRLIHRLSEDSCDIPQLPSQISNQENKDFTQDPVSWIQNSAVESFQKLCQFFSDRFHTLQQPYVRLLIMGVFALMALIHTQSGDVVSSLGRFIVLWKGFLRQFVSLLKGGSKLKK